MRLYPCTLYGSVALGIAADNTETGLEIAHTFVRDTSHQEQINFQASTSSAEHNYGTFLYGLYDYDFTAYPETLILLAHSKSIKL